MQNLNLQWVVLTAILGILAIILFTGPGEDAANLPALELVAQTTTIHPPQTVRITTNQDAFPEGTVFSFFLNDAPLQPSLPANLLIESWPTEIKGIAKNGKTTRTASISFALQNEPPRFHSMNLSTFPASREKVAFQLLYRVAGCDVSGQPTAIWGIEDPDYTATDIYNDTNDNWRYRVEVEQISTGKQEAVYSPEGSIHVISSDEWTTDARFLWIPDSPPGSLPFPIFFDDFDPAPRPFGPMAVTPEAPAGTGFLLKSGQPLGPAGCTTVDPTLPDPPSGDPTHIMSVSVLEYGKVHTERYHIFVYNSTCAILPATGHGSAQ